MVQEVVDEQMNPVLYLPTGLFAQQPNVEGLQIYSSAKPEFRGTGIAGSDPDSQPGASRSPPARRHREAGTERMGKLILRRILLTIPMFFLVTLDRVRAGAADPRRSRRHARR